MRLSRIISRLRGLGSAALLGLWLWPGAPAAAQEPIPGADAPDLVQAVRHWLHSAEDVGLIALADLAHEGNDAARLLLAIIDKTPSLQGPWLAHLPRDERIALLRQPGGLSGRSWFHALTDLPLGAVWLSLMDPSTGPEAVLALLDLGENRAAREALVMLAAREHPGLRALDPARIHPELVFLLWRGADDARRADLMAHIRPGSAQHALIDGTLDTDRLQTWLSGTEAGAPLDAICAHECPETRATCLSNAYRALASHNALLTLGSPVEALIPQAEFLVTPRGRETTLRRILQTHDARGRRALISQLREHDACLADVLDAEAARYRYRRPGNDSPAGD